MKFYPIEAGSNRWYEARLGIPTSSQFAKIITPLGKPSTQARTYMYRLIAERLLKETQDDQLGYVQWVDHGKGQEGNAAAMFEFTHERQLRPGGFVTTDDGRIGCSPDRLVGKNEAVEIKAPAPWTQIGYLLDGPGDNYRPQVQGQLFVGEFDCVHFYSYHPQMPPFEQITLPDLAFLGMLRSALSAFCDTLDVMTERARSLGAYAVARRIDTPADVAYQADEDAALKIVVPGDRDDGTS